MTEATARTVTASVLVLSIDSYGRRAVAEQLALRERLNAAVTLSLGETPPAHRIIVNTPEGVAIIFTGGENDALAAACILAPLLAPTSGKVSLPVQGGLNHGPVHLAQTAQTLGVSGDAMTVAETLVTFAEAGQIVASRAFRDAAGETGADNRFRLLGTRTDSGVRTHEVFALHLSPGADTRPGTARPAIRPRVLVIASVLATALILAGFAAREMREAAEAKRRPGVIRLAVKPSADVIVDSTYRGIAPPMKSVEVPPGRHTVELKRAGHPTRNVQVDLKPGEEIELQHTFLERPRQKTFWERLGL